MATIVLKPHPKAPSRALAVVEGGRLDGAAWGKYCAVGPFDRDYTARGFARSKLADVLAGLAGLAVVVHPDLTAHAEAARAETLERVANADARVSEAEARSGRVLYPFQRDGARWLASRACALLADEMGTGKTAQSLVAAGRRVVVVAPASLRRNWEREAGIWRPDLRVSLLDGLGAFRWPDEGEMVVLGYEGLPAAAEELAALEAESKALEAKGKALSPAKAITLAAGVRSGSCPVGVTLIADEAHALKGSARKTQRVERFRTLAGLVREAGGASWALTATPLLNRPMELWNVAMAAGIAREAFGSFARFKVIAGGRDGRFGLEWDPSEVCHSEIASSLRPVMLRRLKRDVLAHLPAKQRQTVEVSLALKASEEKALRVATDLLAEDTDPEDLDPAFPGFEKLSRALAILGERKAEAAEDLLSSYEEAGEPIVVFSCHQSTVDALRRRPGWVGFHGGTTEGERQDAVDAFQRGAAKGIALTIAAGGVGITLTRAKTAVFLERSWTPALDAQAEDRIHRIGQEAEHVSYVTVLADHPIDRRISELQERKRAFVVGVDEAARGRDEEAYVPPPQLFLGDPGAFEEWAAEHERDRLERERAAAEWAAGADERKAQAKRERAEARARERRLTLRAAQEQASGRHVAESDVEQFVVAAIQSLIEADADHARLRNGDGFSKTTSAAGHALGWTADLGWTDDQWREARGLVHHHRRQVGPLPR